MKTKHNSAFTLTEVLFVGYIIIVLIAAGSIGCIAFHFIRKLW